MIKRFCDICGNETTRDVQFFKVPAASSSTTVMAAVTVCYTLEIGPTQNRSTTETKNAPDLCKLCAADLLNKASLTLRTQESNKAP